MWKCMDSPDHNRFCANPAWVEFDSEMTAMTAFEFPEVRCLECGSEACWFEDMDEYIAEWIQAQRGVPN